MFASISENVVEVPGRHIFEEKSCIAITTSVRTNSNVNEESNLYEQPQFVFSFFYHFYYFLGYLKTGCS
jgi:hypothetical protein